MAIEVLSQHDSCTYRRIEQPVAFRFHHATTCLVLDALLGSGDQQAELFTENTVVVIQRDVGTGQEVDGKIDIDPDLTRVDAHMECHDSRYGRRMKLHAMQIRRIERWRALCGHCQLMRIGVKE